MTSLFFAGICWMHSSLYCIRTDLQAVGDNGYECYSTMEQADEALAYFNK